ncbi:TPA: DUF2971 domain-containing protein [Stenotrophomonas maltophilia]
MSSKKEKTPPDSLYRYRPLGEEFWERELEALGQSYLYAPRFDQMNDPMEALFEVATAGDLMASMLPPEFGFIGTSILEDTAKRIKKSGLISMSVDHLDYPLWAYYGSSFGGMCLEFDTTELAIGVLSREILKKVVYDSEAPPPVSFQSLAMADPIKLVNRRLTQKRDEWRHEKEWRYLAGQPGPKPHTDAALRTIYLGPRIRPEEKAGILEIMARRPVDIYEATVAGYHLEFHKIKSATPWLECDRVGSGLYNPDESLSAEEELRKALGSNFEVLERKCKELSEHPNVESVDDVYLTSSGSGVHITTTYAFRDRTRTQYVHYFDFSMNPITKEAALLKAASAAG